MDKVNDALTPLTSTAVHDLSGTCFICLDGKDEENSNRKKIKRRELVSCCTQCYSVVHRKCWTNYKRNLKLSTLRAQLLAQNQPNIFNCSICKSGVARIDHESHEWDSRDEQRDHLQDELFQVIGRMLTETDTDDNEEEPACCGVALFLFHVGLLAVVIAFNICLVWKFQFYPGDVTLWTLGAIYIFGSVELLVLAILQRRDALGPLVTRSGGAHP